MARPNPKGNDGAIQIGRNPSGVNGNSPLSIGAAMPKQCRVPSQEGAITIGPQGSVNSNAPLGLSGAMPRELRVPPDRTNAPSNPAEWGGGGMGRR